MFSSVKQWRCSLFLCFSLLFICFLLVVVVVFFFVVGGGGASRCYRVGLMLIMSLLACCAVFTNEAFVCKLFYNRNFYHPFR